MDKWYYKSPDEIKANIYELALNEVKGIIFEFTPYTDGTTDLEKVSIIRGILTLVEAIRGDMKVNKEDQHGECPGCTLDQGCGAERLGNG